MIFSSLAKPFCMTTRRILRPVYVWQSSLVLQWARESAIYAWIWIKGSGTVMTRHYKDVYQKLQLFCMVLSLLILRSAKMVCNGPICMNLWVPLIVTLPFTLDHWWKDLGQVNTFKLAISVPLKSTIIPKVVGFWLGIKTNCKRSL